MTTPTLTAAVRLTPDALFTAEAASDAALMERVQAGDREAFGQLVDRHGDALVAYLARLCGRREQAEDLAQEAFLKLYRAAGRYREQGQLVAFLYRIATNELRSQERRERRWNALRGWLGLRPGAPAFTAEPAAPPLARLERDEQEQRLRRAVARLPLRLRAPLVLAEVEGWPLAQIAQLLGCREGTVKSRRFRARELLRRELAAGEPAPEAAPAAGPR